MPKKCHSMIPHIGKIPGPALLFIGILNSTTAVLNILANGALMYGLKKTGQLRQKSCQLIFLMSLSDFFAGLIGQTLGAIVLTQDDEDNCAFKLITQFISTSCLQFSAAMITLVAYDRYIHMKYLMRYSSIMSTKRLRSLLTLCAIATICMSAGQVISCVEEVTFTYYLASLVVMVPVPAVIFILYFKAYKAIQTRVEATVSMQNAVSRRLVVNAFMQNKKFAKATRRILICLSVLWTPQTVVGSIWFFHRHYHRNELGYLNAMMWLAFLLLHVNSVCNAIIFLLQNNPIQQLYKNILSRRGNGSDTMNQVRKETTLATTNNNM